MTAATRDRMIEIHSTLAAICDDPAKGDERTALLTELAAIQGFTVRVECACKVCKANAAQLHRIAPLAAMTTPEMAQRVGKDVHGLVSLAHHPVLGSTTSAHAIVKAV